LKPIRIWLLLFGAWVLFISGVGSQFVGSPGAIQAIRLQALLNTKKQTLADLEIRVRDLEQEAVRLDKSRHVQLREIRRTLGYAAPDELIFDFSDSEAL